MIKRAPKKSDYENLTYEKSPQSKRFRKWTCWPKDGSFVVTLEFKKNKAKTKSFR